MALTKTILLVEDNPNDELMIKVALKDNKINYDVVVAHDGVEALDYLFRTGPYKERDKDIMPQLILLDINIPKISGLEVLRKIRENTPTRFIPVIILTASKEEKDLMYAYKLGANSFLEKSVDFKVFYESVKQMGIYWLGYNATP
ncbi:MAG: response regulator [Bacteroidota bacterium]|nr:response regulator [Bacteroidota bacterium]